MIEPVVRKGKKKSSTDKEGGKKKKQKEANSWKAGAVVNRLNLTDGAFLV